MKPYLERHRKHANPFSIRNPPPPINWVEHFGRQAPLALDIGCGRGAFSIELAKRNPEWDVIAVEIRQILVDYVNACAKEEGVANHHSVMTNINLHLDKLVPDNSLIFVSLNFPDPWFKRRQSNRRVVQPEWLDALAHKMRPDGAFHIMTDFKPVADDALRLLLAHPSFKTSAEPPHFLPESTTGIVSEREIKHSGRGEPVHRLLFTRT